MSRVNQIEADKPRKADLLPLFFPCPRATDARGQGKIEGGGWLGCLNLIHPRPAAEAGPWGSKNLMSEFYEEFLY